MALIKISSRTGSDVTIFDLIIYLLHQSYSHIKSYIKESNGNKRSSVITKNIIHFPERDTYIRNIIYWSRRQGVKSGIAGVLEFAIRGNKTRCRYAPTNLLIGGH